MSDGIGSGDDDEKKEDADGDEVQQQHGPEHGSVVGDGNIQDGGDGTAIGIGEASAPGDEPGPKAAADGPSKSKDSINLAVPAGGGTVLPPSRESICGASAATVREDGAKTAAAREEGGDDAGCGRHRRRLLRVGTTTAAAAVVRAFARRPFEIDYTQIALLPPARTAALLVAEWCIFGVGNPSSTAFQLGCLYVGFTDVSGSLGLRIRYMGCCLFTTVLVGALLPSLLWNRSAAVNVVVAFLIGLGTGLSPITGSSELLVATKLGAALFAINLGLNRSTGGAGGIGTSVLFTFFGGAASLALAALPEIVGNRDAVRTDMFRVWNGFGRNLLRWKGSWGTVSHLSVSPTPTVTLSIAKTAKMVSDESYVEEEAAKGWLVGIMKSADTIRAGCLCLSNTRPTGLECGSSRENQQQPQRADDDGESENNENIQQKEIDHFFVCVGRACRSVAFAIQFPWLFRYVVPLLTRRRFVDRSAFASVADASKVLLRKAERSDAQSQQPNNDVIRAGDDCFSSLVSLIQTQVASIAKLVSDANSWPRYSSPTSIPARVASAFSWPALQNDESWLIRGYAIRYAVAFAVATIPMVTIRQPVSAHWFPMTVALIMGPTHAATYQRVAHRTIGTLLGIGLGCALAPLFGAGSHALLIGLLGLTTYAAIVFFRANYAVFTFFITGWVYVTVVGPGGSLDVTTLYRCLWTLSAGSLVIIVLHVYPPRVLRRVGDYLAAMAKALKAYAEATVAENSLRRQIREDRIANVDIHAALEAAGKRLDDARRVVIKARLAMLERINEAMFTPAEVLETDALASKLASDLIDAVIIPQSVALVAASGGNAADLLSDIDQDTYNEIDRLVARFEQNVYLTAKRSGSRSESVSSLQAAPPTGKGPFSNAIARAHRRLDKAGVPSLASANEELAPTGDIQILVEV